MPEYVEKETLLRQAIEERRFLLRLEDVVNGDSVVFRTVYKDLAEFIRNAPTADVAPVRHARWERDEDGDWRCTGCRETVAICDEGRERTYRKPYCPNCGARMDGDPDGLR